MRRPPLAAIFAAAAFGTCLGLSPALGQKPNSGAPIMAPIPTGKPPPLGVPWNGGSGATDDTFGSGTGFVVADRRLLTNRHVVVDCARVVARDATGSRLAARVIVTDREHDLALLSTEKSPGPPLTFREDPPVRRGEAVVVYGFPLPGLVSSGPTLTTGNINALAGLHDNAANFQISAAVQPGNSGSPLFDSQGHIIGVVVLKLNAARVAELTGGDIPQNVNFAVKGSVALAFLRANDVRPAVAASTGPERRPDEIDAVANPSTLYLQCLR